MINMPEPPQNLVQDSMKSHKYSKEYPQKAKGMSLYAFLFSIFIYISIFYIFNLSPSTLFNNTKFWFVISNTLILIIAADYGAYSSSKDNTQDLYYQHYMMHSQATPTTPSLVSQYHETVKKSSAKQPKIREEEEEEEVAESDHQNRENPENKLQMVHKTAQDKPGGHENVQEKRVVHVAKGGNYKENSKAKTYVRSKSEKMKREVMEESKNIHLMLRSSDDQKKHEALSRGSEDSDEFSGMSDEELNNRVEEFIQRFNRQIRLQSSTISRPTTSDQV